MNTTQTETKATDSAAHVCTSLVETLVDVGATWAAYGLKMGKMALVASAETLGKTAQALETIATEIEKKAAVHGPEVEAAPVETPAAPVDAAPSAN